MRFFQASDFHLRPDRPERVEALRHCVARAVEAGADALLIPGDLFDDAAAASALRPDARRAFESFPGPVLLLPGNHDPAAEAYPPTADLGRRTVVLTGEPWCEHVVRIDGEEPVHLIGAPYHADGSLGRDLAGLETDPLRTVLLAHGTLRAPWVERLRPSEGEERAYYPIREQDLRDRFGYAALGHLHEGSRFDDWTNVAAWGYSGSPVAITRGEIGPRHAVRVDFRAGDGVQSLERLRLDTPYWAEPIECAAVPWVPAATIVGNLVERVEEASEPADPLRGLRVRLGGWLDGDERWARATLEAEIHDLAARHRAVEIEIDVRGVAELLERHEWLGDLQSRMLGVAETEGVDAEVVRRATEYLIEAVLEAQS